MKKIFLSSILALASVLLISNTAKAQLEDGSIAPDWTLTDINGNSWNLYTLLNEGKSVFLDFSAVWCGPCWSYHNTGNLETLYEEYGPDGTDEVMVFYIEGDGASTMDEMNGIGAGTQGDWITGTPYPMILTHAGDPNYQVVSDYSIAYFPTIYRICPNRIVDEVGQVSSTVLYNSIGDCQVATTAVDPAILQYTGPVVSCSDVELTVTIQNMGFDALTACTITAYDGGTELTSFEWTGDLLTYETADVNLGAITLADDFNEIEIEITSADGNADNNTVTTEITYEDNVTMTIHLELKTDSYPTETRWQIVDESTGDIIYEDGPYSNAEKNEIVFDEDLLLPATGCYTFTCFDQYGDGITGSGYYKLYDADGSLITSGMENVGKQKSDALRVTDQTAIENKGVVEHISLYPNPADETFTIDLNLSNAAELQIAVVDLFGREVAAVANETISSGNHSFTVNTADLSSGVYFVKVNGNDLNQAVKFTVAH